MCFRVASKVAREGAGGAAMFYVRDFALLFATLLVTGTVAVVGYDVYLATRYHRLVVERARLMRVVSRRLDR